jgi:hypothetical protein
MINIFNQLCLIGSRIVSKRRKEKVSLIMSCMIMETISCMIIEKYNIVCFREICYGCLFDYVDYIICFREYLLWRMFAWSLRSFDSLDGNFHRFL